MIYVRCCIRILMHVFISMYTRAYIYVIYLLHCSVSFKFGYTLIYTRSSNPADKQILIKHIKIAQILQPALELMNHAYKSVF